MAGILGVFKKRQDEFSLTDIDNPFPRPAILLLFQNRQGALKVDQLSGTPVIKGCRHILNRFMAPGAGGKILFESPNGLAVFRGELLDFRGDFVFPEFAFLLGLGLGCPLLGAKAVFLRGKLLVGVLAGIFSLVSLISLVTPLAGMLSGARTLALGSASPLPRFLARGRSTPRVWPGRRFCIRPCLALRGQSCFGALSALGSIPPVVFAIPVAFLVLTHVFLPCFFKFGVFNQLPAQHGGNSKNRVVNIAFIINLFRKNGKPVRRMRRPVFRKSCGPHQ
jgi:hypothetical protein